MKYEVKFAKRYKKAYKKLSIKHKEVTLAATNKLANDEKYKDHILKGEFIGFRECHICLIYS